MCVQEGPCIYVRVGVKVFIGICLQMCILNLIYNNVRAYTVHSESIQTLSPFKKNGFVAALC